VVDGEISGGVEDVDGDFDVFEVSKYQAVVEQSEDDK
jgi:hypothetical protein